MLIRVPKTRPSTIIITTESHDGSYGAQRKLLQKSDGITVTVEESEALSISKIPLCDSLEMTQTKSSGLHEATSLSAFPEFNQLDPDDIENGYIPEYEQV